MFTPAAHKLDKLAVASPFALSIFNKKRTQAQAFLAKNPFNKPITDDEFDIMVREFVGVSADDNLINIDESQVMQGLRNLRNLLMLKWIWQDALQAIALEQLTYELSAFANACINFTKAYAYANLVNRFGVPMTKVDGKKRQDEFAIIAMGKLGAMELNLSSDIDLVFVHLGDGETDISQSGKKVIENHKFMLHLGRAVIRLLDEITADGFVFRVDMRLRPWGDGSPLVMNLGGLRNYFNQHGRTWERFAWLKGRTVNAISDEFNERLMTIAKNFVYRYYIDYTAFSALREMKTMIVSQQMQRQDLDNIKLGSGGIRDIEFIVQAFCLIYGGHHVQLSGNLTCLTAIERLTELGYLTAKDGENLSGAYRFLRRLEHAIQARHDKQTQRLPSDETELVAIAKTLDFNDVASFYDTLNMHRATVIEPFSRMVTDRQSPKQELAQAHDIKQQLDTYLTDESKRSLDEFWQSKLVTSLDHEPKSRLETAYPVLLYALLLHAKNDGVDRANLSVPRLIAILEAICRRSIYLVMIAENPNATISLIPMLSASPWVAKELALHPVLLDNFLQKRYLHLPNKAELTDILRQHLLRVEPFDDENYLNAIRTFKKTQVLAVATADILGLRHIMKVSDSLTFIAEVVLESALYRAFDELVSKHGSPRLTDGTLATAESCGFAIIGYGKLGGLEMSYASDLDVVFLHAIDERADTDGARVISGMKFASRLVQKVITYLTTQTLDGRAYELDMRLRPSGNAGVMIVSTHAFDIYQNEKAWAWEHQALVRARGICGDKAVLAQFDSSRIRVLTTKRDIAQVKQDVNDMRQKMQSHLGSQKSHEFHLKQDFGGLVDIEFLAQFMVLGYAHKYPNLAIYPDNVRIFKEISKTGIWTPEQCDRLTQAYLKLRQKTHELALLEQKMIVHDDTWQCLRTYVCTVWESVLG
ncbi:bifunctional [glutamate--ammonia ligase]-adenylyl-L-tyrosine phosphorylase/[glutamate--ammonia-ligase] adenylyltransferase [Moraxella nasovis]|uniref:bifunctional [glutamate--ammonia ligase]-adenylyl-L-tyrosine phosphorylase/[glutamate--ammonia-ligase] adenylyltransferase n=1 Tax=Moraxella nasovis TaxID=2904121 RepID=UPI001F608830|nr:bifunctional [glutamate--ammonia ligase]-adenylyl-L-tyrosine phosphorylase/[glutamate--ammonia-ligase] adenylyltransferase [Moraxella nasovis]UNU73411.1 bifunctional [glutamate--ammonia ligase]-adenylyl-L-tyrosine phosphorylase/[glutamate--ammonia-ligase] adenylyltransferase [Moraxella nasovis]